MKEGFPVYRYRADRGLKAVVEPVAVQLVGEVGTSVYRPPSMVARTIGIEPMVPIAEVRNLVLRTTPVADPVLLKFCFTKVGHAVKTPWGSGVIHSFRIGTHMNLPIHEVTVDNTTRKVVITAMGGEILPTVEDPAAQRDAERFCDLKVALSQVRIALAHTDQGEVLRAIKAALEEGRTTTLPSVAQENEAIRSAVDTCHGLVREEKLTQDEAVNVVREVLAEVDAAQTPQKEDVEIDPNARVHTVCITVTQEIPFDLFWPMVRDDIFRAMRGLAAARRTWRSPDEVEQQVQAGVARDGMGPIVRGLTMEEAEGLATRLSNIVQTSIVVDRTAMNELNNDQSADSIHLGARLEFRLEGNGAPWVLGTVVSRHCPTADAKPDKYDLIDDKAQLHEGLRPTRIRMPKTRLGRSEARNMVASALHENVFRLREQITRRRTLGRFMTGPVAGLIGHGLRGTGFGGSGELELLNFLDEPGVFIDAVRADNDAENDQMDPDEEDDDEVMDVADGEASEVNREASEGIADGVEQGFDEGDGDGSDRLPQFAEAATETTAAAPEEDVPGIPQTRVAAVAGGHLIAQEERRHPFGETEPFAEEIRMMEELFTQRVIQRGPGDLGSIRIGGFRAQDQRGGPVRVSRPGGDNKESMGGPLRCEFAALFRAADGTSTSSLDHPVADRIVAADLSPAGDRPVTPEEKPDVVGVTFGLKTGDKEPNFMSMPASLTLFRMLQLMHTDTTEGGLLNIEDTFVLHFKVDVSRALLDVQGPVCVGGDDVVYDGAEPARKRRRLAEQDTARRLYAEVELKRLSDLPGVGGAVQALWLLRLMHQDPAFEGLATEFVSAAVDKKLRNQLHDPLCVVSGGMPVWVLHLTKLCPFLFSSKTRKVLLKYTAFGMSYSIHWMQESQVGDLLRRRATIQTELNSVAATNPHKLQELSQDLSNIEDHIVRSPSWVGSLKTTLAKLVKGPDLVPMSERLLELCASSPHMLEIQFDGETGFGAAVTRGFYNEICKSLQERDVNRAVPMWVEDSGVDEPFLLSRRGLLTRPLPADFSCWPAVESRFRFLGRLMGKALREGFLTPLPLTSDFFKLVQGVPLDKSALPRTGDGLSGEFVGVVADFLEDAEAQLRNVDSALRQEKFKELCSVDEFGAKYLHSSDVDSKEVPRISFTDYISVGCFLETGTGGAELCKNGVDITVTPDNVHEFLKLACEFWLDKGVQRQVAAFRQGLGDVFPVESLATFTAVELQVMFCGDDEIEWDEKSLLAQVRPLGGLTSESQLYKLLIAEMLAMDKKSRSLFLDFVTSCPRLPPGGMSKFHMDVYPENTENSVMPRSRACANQLYLPPYRAAEELHERLQEAMLSSSGHHR